MSRCPFMIEYSDLSKGGLGSTNLISHLPYKKKEYPSPCRPRNSHAKKTCVHAQEWFLFILFPKTDWRNCNSDLDLVQLESLYSILFLSFFANQSVITINIPLTVLVATLWGFLAALDRPKWLGHRPASDRSSSQSSNPWWEWSTRAIPV